jgi:amidophosphoribosyltransferase
MLRDAGAREVHLRISSPPFRWPCFYGIDTPNRDELLASSRTNEEVREFLGCDSIDYVTLEHLVEAIGAGGAGFCDACLTGNYPTRVPVEVRGASGVGA